MSTILGPPVGYVDLLNSETTDVLKREEAAQRTFNPIRPSAAGKCTREMFYELMEYHGYAKYEKELKTPSVHRLLNLGHSIEYHLIKQFEMIKDIFSIKYKQQVLSFKYFKAKNPKHSHLLEGSLDLVFWSDKYRCVADVKSKNDRYDFRSRKMKWDLTSEQLSTMTSVSVISADAFWVENLEAFLEELDDPFFAANFLQLNLYALNPFIVERGINHGAIIQYNKNDSRIREIRFKPSQKLYDATLAKYGNVIAAVDAQDESLASRDHAEGSFKCRYCPFQKQCWGRKSGRGR